MPLYVLEVSTAEGTEWMLTDELTQARQCCIEIGGVGIAVHYPCDVLSDQFGGIAFLSTDR